MRRILRKIAEGEADKLGDTSTLADPSIVEVSLGTKLRIHWSGVKQRTTQVVPCAGMYEQIGNR